MAKCATCGMSISLPSGQVDEKTAAAKTEFKGETYYFCSSNCKVAFEKNPQQFVDKAKSTAQEHKH